MKFKDACSLKKNYDQPRQHIKKQRHYFVTKVHLAKLWFFQWSCMGGSCQVTSVVSNSVRPHRRQPTRLRHPWDSPGKNTGVGCHFLLQRRSGWESWPIKKAEHQRIDTLELWCWRRLLRVTWTARRPNQSIRKEISPGCSLEGLMLKLKLQCFGHLMRRVDSLEKTLMLGGIGGRRRRGRQRMRWLDGITNLMDMGLGGL